MFEKEIKDFFPYSVFRIPYIASSSKTVEIVSLMIANLRWNLLEKGCYVFLLALDKDSCLLLLLFDGSGKEKETCSIKII